MRSSTLLLIVINAMMLVASSAEPSTTAELIKRSKFSASESHTESIQHSSSSSN
ncbi:42209_t:CDS:1, partial [Gigaspora margarita]